MMRRGGLRSATIAARVLTSVLLVPARTAAAPGRTTGDLIEEVDREPVAAVGDLERRLRDGSALLRVRRDGIPFYTVLTRPR